MLGTNLGLIICTLSKASSWAVRQTEVLNLGVSTGECNAHAAAVIFKETYAGLLSREGYRRPLHMHEVSLAFKHQ